MEHICEDIFHDIIKYNTFQFQTCMQIFGHKGITYKTELSVATQPSVHAS